MTTDPNGQPWSGATYRGFSGPAAFPQAEPRAGGWPIPRGITIAGGVAVAVALGLGLGFLAKPDLIRSVANAPMRPAVISQADLTAPKMSIEVNRPAPLPAVKPAGPLEVLPPDMARSASRATPATAPAVADASRALTPDAPRLTPPPPSRMVELETPPPLAPPRLSAPRLSAPPLAAPSQPAADSACAGSRAERLVCSDPDLSAADRELNRAYRRAMRSGVPPEQLRAEQRDWLAIREDAARRSPRAVADIYEQRIDELNQLADDGPG